MPAPATPSMPPGQAFAVFLAEDLHVSSGVNQGDTLDGPGGLCLGDAYMLAQQARPVRLILTLPGSGPACLAPGTEGGQPGAPITLRQSLIN